MMRLMAVLAGVLLGAGGVLAPASADSVRIGVNIGVPAPVVVAPPAPVVVVPQPPVIVTPGVPIYYYGAQYYTYYNGAWFVGPRYVGPWSYIAVARVPHPIIAVPHVYSGHPHGGPPPGHGHGRRW